jgi:hypothetical protein
MTRLSGDCQRPVLVAVDVDDFVVPAARAMCSPQCSSPERAVSYIGWSGTVESFDMRSETYALAFMLANREKLINVSPENRAKLQDAMQRGSASPVHISSAPVSTTPSSIDSDSLRMESAVERADRAFLKWIEKIVPDSADHVGHEAARRGAIARRARGPHRAAD